MVEPVVVEVVMLPGQVIRGGWLSTTVTLNEQDVPAVAMQVTTVVPTGKKLPGAGEQVTVPQIPAPGGTV